MTKEVELFDKKFVYFMWDDILNDKYCFTADDMENLIRAVNNDYSRRKVTHTYSTQNPFRNVDTSVVHCFAYYDPNYDAKRAYNEGKKIQVKSGKTWYDISEPTWVETSEYRIAPETHRMTYRELAEWLAKGNGQCKTDDVAVTQLSYDGIDEKDNRELPDEYKIRPWGSDKWIEPTFDVYSEDCGRD